MIIGLTGTLGAGKGMIVEYLETKGFVHFSVREYLVKELEKRNMDTDRKAMIELANQLRAENSPSYIVEELYKEAEKTGKDSVIESIRTVGEVQKLRELGNFYLFSVDAEPKIRHERVVKRATTTDNVNFEEFLEHEKRELTNIDPNKQNISRCMEMSDFSLTNNGTIEELYKQVEKVLQSIKDK